MALAWVGTSLWSGCEEKSPTSSVSFMPFSSRPENLKGTAPLIQLGDQKLYFES